MSHPSLDEDASDLDRAMEKKLTKLLGPYEPLIMKTQSLLVWECPWKSVIFFTSIHAVLWFICTTSSRFFFLLSIIVMTMVFIDTWKNRIWPEIRVPPKEPEDQDGWTPVHPRLLSVPELSTHLSQWIANMVGTFRWLRRSRVTHPLVFCLGNTAFFTITAMIGYYFSGFMLAYIVLITLMLWPSVLYHSLLKKAFIKMEPVLTRISGCVKNKLQRVITIGGRFSLPVMGGEHRVEDEDFIPQASPEAIAALTKALADSEDEGGLSAIPTPRMSKNTSFNNLLEEMTTDKEEESDFQLELTQMPSFDDIDNTDDDLDLPSASEPSLSSRLSDLHFAARHFADSEDDRLDFSNSEVARGSNNGGGDAASLTGSLVARTLSSMVESALHGMATLGQGQTASSSSMIPRTGAKLTYTWSEEGESIDFQNPEPTILESDEEEEEEDDMTRDSISRSEQIAEIEKDFDFLDELDHDKEDKDDV